MAHKDFVKRGQVPKKKPQSKNAPAQVKLPWIRIVVTVLLVVGFVYFLWSISRTDVEISVPEAVESATPATEQATSTDDIEPLPDMPIERYSYPEELKHGNVEIDRKEQQKSERPYLMQCGSFRKQTQADEMRAKLAMQGLESQVRRSEGKNGLWYRVVLGPYDYKRDAEADRHIIQKVGIGSCQIWYWDL
ncbi:SPOR domain-containing protein [Aliiglaciecola sp. LCG003]|uniref:SPOR domain-containing protein n=1 Tax=Aliiglaciecola sp. LCG003 TaxID=3053655 RepID=UPI00257324FD|nr:SPOR domain-containing protein [Aliiglaciecola sp. LCG003]WJG09119.1 SPOR domain-containing protein [Aliiglaciecola sp. LCG003]